MLILSGGETTIYGRSPPIVKADHFSTPDRSGGYIISQIFRLPVEIVASLFDQCLHFPSHTSYRREKSGKLQLDQKNISACPQASAWRKSVPILEFPDSQEACSRQYPSVQLRKLLYCKEVHSHLTYVKRNLSPFRSVTTYLKIFESWWDVVSQNVKAMVSISMGGSQNGW